MAQATSTLDGRVTPIGFSLPDNVRSAELIVLDERFHGAYEPWGMSVRLLIELIIENLVQEDGADRTCRKYRIRRRIQDWRQGSGWSKI